MAGLAFLGKRHIARIDALEYQMVKKGDFKEFKEEINKKLDSVAEGNQEILKHLAGMK